MTEQEDNIGGDEISVGDIKDSSAVAIGRGAQAFHIGDKYILERERPPLWLGVPPLPPHFTGREELVDDLVRQLTGGQTLALSAAGLPGVGKTTLAVALAHHKAVLAHFSGGVLWGGLGPGGEPERILAEWAAGLGEDISQLAEIEERRRAVQRLIGQQKLLLVIDDAWELAAAQALRCGGPHCVHLLTTRDAGLARTFAGAAGTASVPELAEGPAFALLQTLAPEACAAGPEAARELAQVVGGLPLALELLGGYLGAPEHSAFSDLAGAALAEMADPAHRLQLATQRLGGRGQTVTLADTIELSVTSLPQEAAAAFYALGAFAPKPESFSRAAAEAVAQTDAVTLALLEARSLLEITGERLALHQTLADVARTHIPDDARTRHQEYYLALANEDRKDWQRIEAAYGQIRHAWRACPDDEELLDIFGAIHSYQQRRGLWQDYVRWAERALRVAETLKWLEDKGTLLNNIGLVYDNLGQRAKALAFYNQTLPIREEVGDQAGLAVTLNNIGGVYASLGQREKALDFYNRALPIHREVGNRAMEATTLTNIGNVYDSLGQREKALAFYNRALPIMEEVGDRAGLAAILNNIGAVYRKLGDNEKALDFYNRALPIMEEVGDRAIEATTLTNIGAVYDSLGQREKALDFYNRALPIREEVGDRAGLAVTLNNIGLVYDNLGQREKALAFYNRALPIMEEVGDRAGLAAMLNNIGAVYNNLGQREKALDFYNRVLPIREEVGDRAGLAATLNNIGGIYYSLGQREKALEFYNRALPIMEEVSDRAGLATTLSNIGWVYNNLGQREEALDFYNRALPIKEEVGDRFGESIMRYIMALIYQDEGNLRQAVAELRRAVALSRLVQSPYLERFQQELAQLEAELGEA